MASQLNFNKKLPSEIQKKEKLPSSPEVVKGFENAHIEFDGRTYYVVWQKIDGVTVGALDARKKFGVGRVWIGRDKASLRPCRNSEQSWGVCHQFLQLFHTNAGAMWWARQQKLAEKRWMETRSFILSAA